MSCEINHIEQKASKTLHEIEYENSKKSNYELQNEKELNESVTAEAERIELDINSSKESPREIDEFCQRELQRFKGSIKLRDPCIEEITSSAERKLDTNLFFVTKQKLNSGKEMWLPPLDVVHDGETLEQATERILNQYGDKFNVYLYGNTPFGSQKCLHRGFNTEHKDRRRCKTFYFFAKYIGGPICDNIEYQWLDRYELQKTLPESVYKNMSHLFLTYK